MNEEPEIIEKPASPKGSEVAGVSVRGILAAVLVGAFCLLCLIACTVAIWQGKEMSPILLTALVGQVATATGFYFGQKGSKQGE